MRGEGRGGEGPVLNRGDLASDHHKRQIAPATQGAHEGASSRQCLAPCSPVMLGEWTPGGRTAGPRRASSPFYPHLCPWAAAGLPAGTASWL